MATLIGTLRAAASMLLAVLSAAALVQPCRADSTPLPPPLMEHHCNACHALNDRLIGPPLLAIAARYRAAADREQILLVLAEKIRHGGGGNWGIVPMVPNDLSVEEARRLVTLILALEPP